MKRIVVLSDIQHPYEDRRLVRSVIKFIGEYQPDEVVQIGDLMDFPQPSRWSKDTAAEFQGSVFEDSKYAIDRFLKPLRAVYDGPVGVLEGNHDERPRVYLARYAPALAESRAFHMDTLLRFDEFGVQWLPDFYDIAPGWVATHGHKGGIRITQDAGKTALNAAVRFGKSVVMGHTHRMALVPKTFGYNADQETLYGFEVGNMMNMGLAQYLKGSTANWQQGFGVIHTEGNYVNAQAVKIENSKFMVDGTVFSVR
jgi:predicted phosphodiesterase